MSLRAAGLAMFFVGLVAACIKLASGPVAEEYAKVDFTTPAPKCEPVPPAPKCEECVCDQALTRRIETLEKLTRYNETGVVTDCALRSAAIWDDLMLTVDDLMECRGGKR